MPEPVNPIEAGLRMAATIIRTAQHRDDDAAYALMTAEIIGTVVVTALSDLLPAAARAAAARDLVALLTQRMTGRVAQLFPDGAVTRH